MSSVGIVSGWATRVVDTIKTEKYLIGNLLLATLDSTDSLTKSFYDSLGNKQAIRVPWSSGYRKRLTYRRS